MSISAFQGISYSVLGKDLLGGATEGKIQTTNVKGTDLESMVGWGIMLNAELEVRDDLNMIYLKRKFIWSKQRKNIFMQFTTVTCFLLDLKTCLTVLLSEFRKITCIRVLAPDPVPSNFTMSGINVRTVTAKHILPLNLLNCCGH